MISKNVYHNFLDKGLPRCINQGGIHQGVSILCAIHINITGGKSYE